LPHEVVQSGSGEGRDELRRLREEVERQRRINAVLMDRVERSNETAGSSMGLFHLASELSQQVDKQQQALRETAKRADLANRAKSEFLANMSHEIRTPMTAILGFTDLLADPTLTPEERSAHIATIKRNGEHLLSIINDILDLSKIETGKMTVERVATSPVSIIEEVASLMRVRAHGQGLELNVRYESPMPKAIQSDPVRLRQILTNLVGNAIKFTSAGHVTIQAAFDVEGDGRLEIKVIDTGIGMTEDELGRVFDSFTQADASTARRFGGSGLGLKISRSLAEMMGWSLTAASSPGRGSTFTLGTTIEDRDVLSLIGADQIPELSQAINAGVASDESQSSDAVRQRAVLAGATILLAEDGQDNRRLINFHLRNAGANVIMVENGATAVEQVRAQLTGRSGTPDEQGVDLILMDMQMPQKDGYTATSEIRSLGCMLPIVALTAHAMDGDRQKCIDAGCNDYLTKPIDRDRLVQGCARWLNRGAETGVPSPAGLQAGEE